jgi:transposase InsO family protein
MDRFTESEWRKMDMARMRLQVVEDCERKRGMAAIYEEILGVSRSTLCRWRKLYRKHGAAAFGSPRDCKRRRLTPEKEQEVLRVRRERGYGPQRIQLYLERYSGIKVSSSTIWNVLRRNKMPPLYMTRYNRPARVLLRRYQKSRPGEAIQMDVKFIRNPSGSRRLYQFTAIDDCTRYRIIKIYPRNTTRNAIDFFEVVRKIFPARIELVQTDNGPEFTTEFTFHLEQAGVRHRLIRPRTPRLNGKVERSHRTDEREFYSKQKFSDAEDLDKKLSAWQKEYNEERIHMALQGKTPAEVLKAKLSTDPGKKNVSG